MTKAKKTCEVHIYAALGQPATDYWDRTMGEPMWFDTKPNHCLWCHLCRKRRPAKNLRAFVHYDQTTFACTPGKGCTITAKK